MVIASKIRGRLRWFLVSAAVAGLVAVLATGSFATHNTGTFELDKNASNDTDILAAGALQANINATATSLNVCQTALPANIPAGGDTILIRAERMRVTANAPGNFGGNCLGVKRVYTVQRGQDDTIARAQASNNIGNRVSLIRDEEKAGPDWDQVFVAYEANQELPPAQRAQNACADLGLDACTYIEDGIGPTTFTGGGTKDHLPVSGWKHTSGASPDKGEILNAYAARATNGGNDSILTFGMDRYAVDGSTDIGFWFFQDRVELNDDGSFSGNQQIGDLLVLGTFTQGGATSNIRIFKWDPANATDNNTLKFEGSGADCVDPTTPDNDTACATVNDTTIPVPWTYTFKGDSVGGWVPAGGFFEGGVNLTQEGLGGCFSSFLAETRSSPSITAVLNDFALGEFEACDSGLTTTPSDGEGNALTGSNTNSIPDISIGTGSATVTDAATLTVTGVADWQGTLEFYLCGPEANVTDALCSRDTGTKVGATIQVDQNSPTPTLSDIATVTSAGVYCWAGYFDSHTDGVPDDEDVSPGECFEVLPVRPTISTDATDEVEVGEPISDIATLAGTASQPGAPIIQGPLGADAAGTITFSLYGPFDEPYDPEAEGAENVCVAANLRATLGPVTVTGNGEYTSPTYIPAAAGYYEWVAAYSGNSPNTLSASGACGDANETSLVTPALPAIETSATAEVEITELIDDTATLSGTSPRPDDSPAQGTITFRVYGPDDDDCSGTSVYTSVVGVLGDGDYDASDGTGGPFPPAVAGTYRWIASYSGDAPNTLPVSGACNDEGETSVVTPRQPALVTVAQPGPGPVPVGTVLSDVATLSDTAPNADGDPAGGTITFKLYGPADDSSTCGDDPVFTDTVSVSGNGDYTSATFTPTAPGWYNWIASYSGDPPNTLPVSGACGDANESTRVIQLQPTIATAQSFVPNDLATITVDDQVGGDLAGSVTFELYVDDATCLGDPDATFGPFDIADGQGDGLSQSVMSNNTGAYLSSATFHWVVAYESDNPAHLDVTSECGVEHSTLTIVNDGEPN